MPAWLLALLPVLIAHYGPAVLAALGGLVSFLIHRYVKNQKLVQAFDWLRAHVGPVVASVEQTYVDDVTKNGSTELTAEQKSEALAAAIKSILDQIPADYLSILRQQFPNPGQLEAYLTTLIEAGVKQLELAKTSAKTTGTVVVKVAQPTPAVITPPAAEPFDPTKSPVARTPVDR